MGLNRVQLDSVNSLLKMGIETCLHLVGTESESSQPSMTQPSSKTMPVVVNVKPSIQITALGKDRQSLKK